MVSSVQLHRGLLGVASSLGGWPSMAREAAGSVERATRSELRRLGASVQSEALAAACVALARQIDASKGAMGAAQAALQLRLTLAEVRAWSESQRPVKDAIDDLNAERPQLRSVAG